MMVRGCFQNFVAFFILSIVSKVENTCDKVDTTADARAITESKLDPKIIAGILPYRTQEQCSEINKLITPASAGKPLVPPNYAPLLNNNPYDDLLFALVSDSMTIFSMYLGHYLDIKDETYIIMTFIQIDDRVKFKQTYDSQHDRCFDDARRAQRHPFANALKVWALGNRQDISIYKDGSDDSRDQGRWLADERPKWESKSRTGLEGMLMKHTLGYARIGVEFYGRNYVPQPNLIDDINNTIKNSDLKDLYTSLVQYIQNDNDYLAHKLHDHCNEHDGFAIWIIVLSTRRAPDAMKSLNEAFKTAFGGKTLKDYVLKCTFHDTVFLDMLAALADPTYKPSYVKPPPPSPPSNIYAGQSKPASPPHPPQT